MVVSNYRSLLNYDYSAKLLRLENVKLFSRQDDHILFILDTKILIFYRKLYINIVSNTVLNIKERQYNIKINLAISCSPIHSIFWLYFHSFVKKLYINTRTVVLTRRRSVIMN